MGSFKKKIAFALVFLGVSWVAHAQDWSPLDARSRSLGGAGVAFADGRADSLYWNPASLAAGAEKVLDFSTGYSFSLSVFADAHLTGDTASTFLHLVDEYSSFNFQSVQSNFNSATPSFSATDVQHVLQIIDDLSSLERPGHGFLADAGGGINIRVGPFGLFVHALASGGGTPVVDFSGLSLTTDPAAFFNQLNTVSPAGALSPAGTNLRNQLITAGLSNADASNLAFAAQQTLGDAAISSPGFVSAITSLAQGTVAGNPTTLYNNNSGLLVRVLAQLEAGVSFALPIFPTLLEAGISLKDVVSETSFERISFAFKDSGSNFTKTIRDDITKNNLRRSSDFNMDLGARATPLEWLVLGLAARNVIPMDLPFLGPGGPMHVDPQVRFGAQATALGFLRLGADIDLLEDESPVLPGYHIRHFGAGLEFDLPVFKLRLGYDDNLAFAGDHGRLTAGFGFDILGFILDFGAQASLVKTEIKQASVDGSSAARSIPTDRVSAGITLGFNVPF